MLLIPAIDMKDGQCVRLRRGRMDDATVFSDDPLAMAAHWAEQGCRRLHLVDLDGAFAGEPRNGALVTAVARELGEIPVQIGGGIRSLDIIARYLDAGVSQVILGTRAVREPEFLASAAERYPGRIILGLDARAGMLATDGWDETTETSAVSFAVSAAPLDLAAIVYTDIERDGMLEGLNLAATVALAEAMATPVIASGGISCLDDLKALQTAFAASPGELMGAITGRAIYAGTLDFKAGQALLDGAG
ncbi:MAG: 1-(5-phosphoribosyl)-5-[(5-phosphoribosylamino)methylideneamino]imidazole-4-carboxamide isomerase [Pseudomonadales bacterium]|nr:1-(5-phosphoribosyl)-5-[(5-phosphoribosylamino)methylideneamino]imidazole-4-carboxamide isomerase [Pseudomonadales bacterium]NIX09591.1 1-(5-phosphoribosyl)-5-[(5-phosphoribosylamino)methylideneamino]imidazole-4-carboxamide isomerase [Pseudomonadales bacterium]